MEMTVVKLLRLRSGQKQHELAARLEYNPGLWHLVENGKHNPPRHIQKRCRRLFGIPPDLLFSSTSDVQEKIRAGDKGNGG